MFEIILSEQTLSSERIISFLKTKSYFLTVKRKITDQTYELQFVKLHIFTIDLNGNCARDSDVF